MKVLLTRPKAQSLELKQKLEARFGSAVLVDISPVFEIEFLAATPPNQHLDGVVFTSANGVEGLRQLKFGHGLTAYCVGDKTQAHANSAGFEAISAGGDVAALESLLREKADGQTLLYSRGLHVAQDLKSLLKLSQITLIELVTYQQADRALSGKAQGLLEDDAPVCIPIFSPRTARRIGAELSDDAKARHHAVCLSPTIAEAAKKEGFLHIDVARRPEVESLMDQIADLVRCGDA